MGDNHKHSKDYATTVVLTVGPEEITYRDWYCNCGHSMGREIVSRRPK